MKRMRRSPSFLCAVACLWALFAQIAVPWLHLAEHLHAAPEHAACAQVEKSHEDAPAFETQHEAGHDHASCPICQSWLHHHGESLSVFQSTLVERVDFSQALIVFPAVSKAAPVLDSQDARAPPLSS